MVQKDPVPVGSICAFAGKVLPEGWLLCDGGSKFKAQFPELFEVIGTTYGGADIGQLFNLPDLQGPIAQGTDESRGAGGEGRHQSSLYEMPIHHRDWEGPPNIISISYIIFAGQDLGPM